LGELAIRVPWERWISNDNDARLDARDLLRQEEWLAKFLIKRRLSVPKVYAVHYGESCDFLLAEFIHTDRGQADLRSLGEFAARLHRLDPPTESLVAQGRRPLTETLSERILRRADVVEKISGLDLALPSGDTLAKALESAGSYESLLHMDLRTENLLIRDGRIRAIVDWSNALVGHPALECARVAEYGLLSPEFLEGYGEDPLASVSAQLQLLYRLDTAVMLAVVALSERPDPDIGRRRVARVIKLRDALQRVIAA
jgi:aminoglycoside phosphotransferase (APT) family kinase protein